MKIIILFGVLAAVFCQQNKYQTAFNIMDLNRDGNVTLQEVQQLITGLDTDGNQLLSKQEISGLVGARGRMYLDAGYNYYDTIDGTADGQVNRSVSTQIFDILDGNDDQRIDFREYRQTIRTISGGIRQELARLRQLEQMTE